MASKIKFETRDERIERMHENNPSKPLELCIAVVDGLWRDKRKAIIADIPERFANAKIDDLGYLKQEILDGVDNIFQPPEQNKKVGLIFCGQVGSGKTHAAYAVLRKIAEVNPEMVAHITTYSNSVSELKKEFNNRDNDYEKIGSEWDKLTNGSGLYRGLVLFDDLSSKNLTEFELDKLLMFFDKRFNYYLPFILTTNVGPGDFNELFGERIASRLLGYCKIIVFDGDNRINV